MTQTQPFKSKSHCHFEALRLADSPAAHLKMPGLVNKGTPSSVGEGAFLCSTLPTYCKWKLNWMQQAYLPASVCFTHFLLLFVFKLCWSTVGKQKPQGRQGAKMGGHSPLVPTRNSHKYWYYNSNIRLVLAFVVLQEENHFSVLWCNRRINFQRTKMPESVSNWHETNFLPVMPAKPVKLIFWNVLPLSHWLNKFPFKWRHFAFASRHTQIKSRFLLLGEDTKF